jgi:toxin ParE1/3/4
MRFELHAEALEEYEAAAHYYGQQLPDLDLRFIACVENAIEAILEDPLLWRPFDEDIRRCLTRGFPYGILYTIAVAHCSREPGYWKHRKRNTEN